MAERETIMTSPRHMTEQQIGDEYQVIQAAKTQPAHFGVLYNKYYKQIFLFIYRRMDDEDMAADITSQVFLNAMLNLYRYEFKGVPFSAWLYRIAMNELNQFFRKNKKQRTVSLDSANIPGMMGEIEEDDNELKRKMMLESIRELEPDDLQIIEMRFFEKKAFKEIGDILNITENHAKVKTYRILDKVKIIMDKKLKKIS